MSTTVTFDTATTQAQLQNYETTAFQTEDSGNSAYLTSFHWAGTATSSYSFGLYQYDALANRTLVVPALQQLGFNASQISDLQQAGGLSSATLNSLNAQLQTALATPSGQAVLNNLQTAWESTLTASVQNDFSNASSDIIGQISSDPIATQRLYDIANQFSVTARRACVSDKTWNCAVNSDLGSPSHHSALWVAGRVRSAFRPHGDT